MPSAQELIAHGRTEEEICELIGADWLVYQDLKDLIASSSEGNPAIKDFDCSVFNGHYATGDVDRRYLDRLEADRNDDVKRQQELALSGGGSGIGLHNEEAV